MLERLAALGIGPDTTAALSLVPLVAVAWADGSIDDKERSAILSAAEEAGLGKENVSYQLLERLLSEPPSPDLLVSWKDYTATLSATLSPEARAALKQDLLARARAVAEAAGGFLGIGRKVSAAEETVLDELASAFSE